MSLLDIELPLGRHWGEVRDAFEVTKKPRGLDMTGVEAIPFAAMEAIPQGGDFEATFTMKAPTAIASGTYFERGDVLVAKITPSFENGKQAITTDLPAPFGLATTEVIPLHPRTHDHDPRFLFFYLLHPDVRSFVAEKMEGATGRQRVPESVLLSLPYPEMTPDDQRSIADVFCLVRKVVRLESRSEGNALALKRAAMRELFTRGLRDEAPKDTEVGSIPASWSLTSIGEHFSVGSGGTPSRGVAEYWQDGSIPWVKTTEIDYRVITDTLERITRAGLENSAAKILPIGTLLMAMYGQGVTRGRVAILGIDAACNQACAAIQPIDESIDRRFLFHFLAFRYDEIRRMSHGGQQQNLNGDIVRALPVWHPTDEDNAEQREIVKILDAIDKKIDLHKRKRAVLEELFKTLLHKLMTGEIRVTDLDLSALRQNGSIELEASRSTASQNAEPGRKL
jgi:type I restriction enzyme S subunit